MTRRATTVAFAAALLVAAAAVLQPGCAHHSGDGSPLGPGGALAAGSPGPAGRTPQPAAAQGLRPAAARLLGVSSQDRLEAVCTVERFCDLMGSRRRCQARELVGVPGLLRSRGLRWPRGIEFVSARVAVHPRAGTVTVAASVRLDARGESPPKTGVGTMFFTLGRVGTTTGGWLITAVTTSP